MAERELIRPVKPHFDEYHDHEGLSCNPQRLIMTAPIEDMADIAIRAYEARTVFPSRRFTKKLERTFDQELTVVEPRILTTTFGILGMLEVFPERRFTVGDVSRATRIPGDTVSPTMKREIYGGHLHSELSTCPDEFVNSELVYMRDQQSGRRLRSRTFSFSGLRLPNSPKLSLS